MEVSTLLEKLEQRGIKLALGDSAIVWGGTPLPAGIVNTIEANKAEIIRYLRNPPQPKPQAAEPVTPVTTSSAGQNHRAWAEQIMTGRAFVYVETPNDPDDEQRLCNTCRTPDALAFYRARTEAWGTWLIVRDGTEEIFNNNPEALTPDNIITFKPGGPQRADLPLSQSKVQ